MTLFLIDDDGSEGSNWDLLVWAEDADEAVRLWREYYGFQADIFPDHMFSIPIHPPEEPTSLRWHRDVNTCDIPTKMAAEALGLALGTGDVTY